MTENPKFKNGVRMPTEAELEEMEYQGRIHQAKKGIQEIIKYGLIFTSGLILLFLFWEVEESFFNLIIQKMVFGGLLLVLVGIARLLPEKKRKY